MRVIKFRALAVVNDKYNNIKVGDFVYGCYIESGCDAPCIIFGDGEQIEIDKKTLGQLTGLTDKNGNDIYENDIIQMYRHCDILGKHKKAERMTYKPEGSHSVFTGMTNNIMSVSFYYGSLCLNAANGSTGCLRNFSDLARPGESMEVIGNIHENPELLEE